MPRASGKEEEHRAVQEEKAWECKHVHLETPWYINVDIGVLSQEPVQHSRDNYEHQLYTWECGIR